MTSPTGFPCLAQVLELQRREQRDEERLRAERAAAAQGQEFARVPRAAMINALKCTL